MKKSSVRHIVTCTDANYMHKVVVFYRSLCKVHNNFILHLFCFDNIAVAVFKKFRYKNVIVYDPKDFETDELLKVKASKVKKYEYYWACNPFITRKVLLEQNVDFVSSCDCDLVFFQSPEEIFKELNGADVLIQPNNFSFQFSADYTKIGYYCASFQCFRKNINSIKILNWWHQQTMGWCSSKFEEGRFGDQKYLDDWRTRFKKVREIANVGTNVAPWSVQKFDLSTQNGNLMINHKYPVIYYHFHSFRMKLKNCEYIITGDRHNSYPISSTVRRLIYEPYAKTLKKTIEELKKNIEYAEYAGINPEGIQLPFDHTLPKI